MAQIAKNHYNRIEDVKILKVGNTYRRCFIKIDIPQDYKRLQKFLSYVVFNSRDTTIIGGYKDYFNKHEASTFTEYSLDETKDVRCEILFTNRMRNKYISIHIAIPEYYTWNRLRTVERDFIFDAEKEYILTYKDLFSSNYREPFIEDFLTQSERINIMAKSGNASYEDSIFAAQDMVWNFVLGDDYLEYTPFAYKGIVTTDKKFPKRLSLIHCKDYLNPELCRKLDCDVYSTDVTTKNNPVIEEQKRLEKEQEIIMKKAITKSEKDKKLESKGQSYSPSLLNVYGNNNDKDPYKDMHFYYLSDEGDYYITGLNKNILELNEEDLSILKEKKIYYILQDIQLLKDLINNQGERVYDFYDKFLTKRPCYSKGEERLKTELSMSFNSNESIADGKVTVLIIVDKDGTVHAPTVIDITGTSKKKLKQLKKLSHKLRNLKMTPGEIANGEKVKTMWSFDYSFYKLQNIL